MYAYKALTILQESKQVTMYNKKKCIPASEVDSPLCNLERANTLGLWSLDCALPVDILSELLPLSTQFSSKPAALLFVGVGPAATAASFFFFPSLLDKLLAPRADPLSPPLNPKKLSCGNGPDRVFILFNPSDDASIGDTEAASTASVLVLEPSVELGLDLDEEVRVSLPLELSFFLVPSLTCAGRQATPKLVVAAAAAGEEEEERGSSLDLGFFLSDRTGELEAKDRGELELDPSGLEESDFLEEEKKRPLKTIF